MARGPHPHTQTRAGTRHLATHHGAWTPTPKHSPDPGILVFPVFALSVSSPGAWVSLVLWQLLVVDGQAGDTEKLAEKLEDEIGQLHAREGAALEARNYVEVERITMAKSAKLQELRASKARWVVVLRTFSYVQTV